MRLDNAIRLCEEYGEMGEVAQEQLNDFLRDFLRGKETLDDLDPNALCLALRWLKVAEDLGVDFAGGLAFVIEVHLKGL
jgi:hypothetical protein